MYYIAGNSISLQVRGRVLNVIRVGINPRVALLYFSQILVFLKKLSTVKKKKKKSENKKLVPSKKGSFKELSFLVQGVKSTYLAPLYDSNIWFDSRGGTY